MKSCFSRFLFVATILLCSCNFRSEDYDFRKKLHSSIKPLNKMSTGYIKIRLDSITDFSWDSVYYFTSDVSSRHISNTIGFLWDGPFVPSNSKRLLFVYKNKVVKFSDFYKYGSSNSKLEDAYMPVHFWTCKSTRSVYSKKDAYFAVSKYCDEYGVEFEFIPLNCLDTKLQDLLNHGCDTTSFSIKSGSNQMQ